MLHSLSSVSRSARKRSFGSATSILVLGVAVGLAGCASPPETDVSFVPQAPAVSPPAPAARKRVSDPIAEGFIDALVQLPGYSPPETTLVFERRALASDPFLQALETAVTARGYGVRKLTTVAGENMVTHQASADPSDAAIVVRTLSFGAAQMRRSFARAEDGSWNPKTSLFIRGADASRVRLGDDAPTAPAPERAPEPARIQAQAEPAPQVTGRAPSANESEVTIAALPVPEAPRVSSITRSVQATSSTPVTPHTPSDTGDHTVAIPKNIAETGVSNYAGIFEGYGNVEELILVFPNDSMVLGADNKRQIRDAIAAADPEQDLFSIIGCSFGATAIENGNELLATGRANRVKEELLFAGVPGEQILDEGCWAGAPELRFPSRGVVLTIKRARV